MNKSPLINLLLIVSLCFGQLVTSVHMAGHFHDNTDISFAALAVNSVEFHTHATHQHLSKHGIVDEQSLAHQATIHHLLVEHASQPNHSDKQASTDCAIYHAYLSQSVCPPSYTSGYALFVRGIPSTQASSAHVAILAPHNRPIRGPPDSPLT